jgi:hypothetical protein
MDNTAVSRAAEFLSESGRYFHLFILCAAAFSMFVNMWWLEKRKGVQWTDRDTGKVRGSTFLFAYSYLFIWFIFLGFLFDEVRTSWGIMGTWVISGLMIFLGAYAGVDVAKIITKSGLDKAKYQSIMGVSSTPETTTTTETVTK